MEFIKLLAKSPVQEKNRPKDFPIYREQDHQDAKPRVDRFPLKSDCALNCITKPHFPCKGIHSTEQKSSKPVLLCDRRNSYPAPPTTSSSPTYPPNHPWFEPGKF